MEKKRVFVTGAGIVSALGAGVEATCQALLKGETGIGRIQHLPTGHTEFPAGEVKMTNREMAQMLGLSYPHDELRNVLLGILAAREAVESAGLSTDDISGAAFISGTTVGGMDKTERHFMNVFDSEAGTQEAVEMKYNDCGTTTDMTADSIGRFKFITTCSTACSSAANAIILGANLIKAGIVEIAVVGGAEALTKFHFNGFNTLMILDADICRPFDADRKGINLGEGAAYIVLESEESAKKRGAKILGELSGYANTCDAFHQTATSENGEGAYLAMRKALDMAGISPDAVDYVNAHGTGTPNNDICELAAMERVWGHRLPHFSSTKTFTGHTTSASGSIEAVIALLAINRGFIPANLGWNTPMKEGVAPVRETITDTEVNVVVDNSFGFGGNDSSLVFSKYRE